MGMNEGCQILVNWSANLDWVAPPILPVIWVRTAEVSGEKQYISF